MPQRSLRRGKITLLVPATIGQECGSCKHSRQQQRRQRHKVPLLGFAVDSDVHSVSTQRMAQNFPEVIRAALYIDVLGTAYPPILVQVHYLAVPSPRFQLLAQADQTHRPTADRRRPISDFQYPFLHTSPSNPVVSLFSSAEAPQLSLQHR